MAVDITAVDFSTLGDTFKKVTQHMRVSSHAPQLGAAAWLLLRGGEGTSRPSRPVPVPPACTAPHTCRDSTPHAAHLLQGCFPNWEELLEKGQRLNRSFE